MSHKKGRDLTPCLMRLHLLWSCDIQLESRSPLRLWEPSGLFAESWLVTPSNRNRQACREPEYCQLDRPSLDCSDSERKYRLRWADSRPDD